MRKILAIALLTLPVVGLLASSSPSFAAPRWVDWPTRGAILRLPVIPYPNWKPGHRGIDLEVREGSEIHAPVSGVVTWVGSINGVASMSVIDVFGYRHTLLPLQSQLTIGDRVSRGEVIGVVATSSHCSRPCVHWGIRKARAYIDPRWLAPPLIYRLHRK